MTNTDLYIFYHSLFTTTVFVFRSFYCSVGRPRHYVINMDKIVDEFVVHPFLSIRTYGNPITLPAKISNGILLDGSGEYIAIGNQSDACISSISRCYQHGLTLSMWTKFRRLADGMLLLTTGNGIKVFVHTRLCRCYCTSGVTVEHISKYGDDLPSNLGD